MFSPCPLKPLGLIRLSTAILVWLTTALFKEVAFPLSMRLLDVQYSVKVRPLLIPAKETLQHSIKHIETCESRNVLHSFQWRLWLLTSTWWHRLSLCLQSSNLIISKSPFDFLIFIVPMKCCASSFVSFWDTKYYTPSYHFTD